MRFSTLLFNRSKSVLEWQFQIKIKYKTSLMGRNNYDFKYILNIETPGHTLPVDEDSRTDCDSK